MSKCESVKWSNLYVLGDEKVDTEHRKLFMLAEAIDTYKNKKDHEQIKAAINELVNYTKIHFANEEKYMSHIEYIHLDNHKKIHKAIVKKLQDIITNFDSTSIDDVYSRVKSFVNNDLVKHIIIEDKKVQQL